MKRFISILLSFLLLLSFFMQSHMFAQGWEKIYGGSKAEAGYAVVPTHDNSYVVAGWTESFGAKNKDVYLLKTNSNGKLLWQQTFGSKKEERGYDVQQTFDSGFIVAGFAANISDKDVFLIKTDTVGNIVWSNTYGSNVDDYGYSVEQTTDTGFIIGGFTNSKGGEMYLVKTDATGNKVWSKNYGGDELDIANSVQQTADGGYVLCGFTTSFGVIGKDIYLVKTNGNGDTLWTNTIGGNGDEYGQSILQTSDGGYIIAGYVQQYDGKGMEVYLVKTDSGGNLQWDKTIGGPIDDQGYDIIITADGGYAISGYTTSYGEGNGDVYLIKTDANGNYEWSKTYGGSIGDKGLSISLANDNGFIISGYKWGLATYDVYVLKTDSLGVSCNVNCILPGDADQNGVADNFDILTIGLGFGATGPPREDSSLVWIPQYAPSWGLTLPGGINANNGDCNGDGKISKDDTLAVLLNYGRIQANKTGSISKCTMDSIPLYLEFLDDSVIAGDTVTALIKFGSSSYPADNVYGLGFSIMYDAAFIDSGSLKVNLTQPSWFYNKINTLSLVKTTENDNRTDVGIVKFDHNNVSGEGTIGTFGIVIEDNIEVKSLIYKSLKVAFSNALAIDSIGRKLPVCLIADSIIVYKLGVNYIPTLADLIRIYPNPSQYLLNINSKKIDINKIIIINLLGQHIYTQDIRKLMQVQVDLSKYQQGMYIIYIETEKGMLYKKFTIVR